MLRADARHRFAAERDAAAPGRFIGIRHWSDDQKNLYRIESCQDGHTRSPSAVAYALRREAAVCGYRSTEPLR
jgi:hypothetical protein